MVDMGLESYQAAAEGGAWCVEGGGQDQGQHKPGQGREVQIFLLCLRHNMTIIAAFLVD